MLQDAVREYPTVEKALSTWPSEIDHLRQVGRENQAKKLQEKLTRLLGLTFT